MKKIALLTSLLLATTAATHVPATAGSDDHQRCMQKSFFYTTIKTRHPELVDELQKLENRSTWSETEKKIFLERRILASKPNIVDPDGDKYSVHGFHRTEGTQKKTLLDAYSAAYDKCRRFVKPASNETHDRTYIWEHSLVQEICPVEVVQELTKIVNNTDWSYEEQIIAAQDMLTQHFPNEGHWGNGVNCNQERRTLYMQAIQASFASMLIDPHQNCRCFHKKVELSPEMQEKRRALLAASKIRQEADKIQHAENSKTANG